MKDYKNIIPRNILASMCFITMILFLNVNILWSLLIPLPLILVTYIFLTEIDFKTRGCAVLSIAIMLGSHLTNGTFVLINTFTSVPLEIIAINTWLIIVGLIALAVISFLVIDKGCAKKD